MFKSLGVLIEIFRFCLENGNEAMDVLSSPNISEELFFTSPDLAILKGPVNPHTTRRANRLFTPLNDCHLLGGPETLPKSPASLAPDLWCH